MPPLGAHHRNMSAPRLQMCTQTRQFLSSAGEALVSPNGVELLQKKGRSRSTSQHSLVCGITVPPLVTAGTCTDHAVPSCPSVLKCWRTYSCKAISCLRRHSTTTNVKKSGENGNAILNIWIWDLHHGGKSTIYIQTVLAKPWDTWM